MIQWRVAVAVVALAGAFGAGWYAQGLRWGADVLSREAAASAAQTEASNRAVAQMAAERIAAQQREADAIQHLARLQHENDDLRARVDAGVVRLRIKATCPSVPATGAVPGEPGRTVAELDRDAERAYFAHRDAIAKWSARLEQCRAEVRARSASAGRE